MKNEIKKEEYNHQSDLIEQKSCSSEAGSYKSLVSIKSSRRKIKQQQKKLELSAIEEDFKDNKKRKFDTKAEEIADLKRRLEHQKKLAIQVRLAKKAMLPIHKQAVTEQIS